jgi:putative inorganic carbon (HCO3(-)) transporter
VARAAEQQVQSSILNSSFFILAGMALGLALFYWGGTLALVALGLLLFGALALLRSDLGLLFVPFTAPLYLIPASIPGIRATGFVVPLHEAALLTTFGATAAGWVWRRLSKSQEPLGGYLPKKMPTITAILWNYAPAILFLLAGALGILIAVERGPALIEFRRLIAEPLIFYVLIKFQLEREAAHGASDQAQFSFAKRAPDSQFSTWLIATLVLSGAIVGLLGLLQYVGLDLAPFLGKKQCFAPDGSVCSNIVQDGGVRRVLSVYGHPNNLGLFLGRVWPLAVALTIARLRTKNRELRTSLFPELSGSWPGTLWLVLGSVLCLGGIVVSFSRGAWLGALAALAVLALGLTKDQRGEAKENATRSSLVLGPSSLKWIVGLGATAIVLGGLALTLRGDVTGGSTPVRLLLWREALGYIRLHPLGIGLDQFGHYHDPDSGLSLIDPSLLNSSERYAAHPHNLLLDTWLRVGPLGLLAFGWLLARFLRNGRRHADDPIVLGALAAMVAALAHGLVDNFYFVPDLALTFWLLIVLKEESERT